MKRDVTKNCLTNPECFRGWPPLIKVDESVKAKVEKLFGSTRKES